MIGRVSESCREIKTENGFILRQSPGALEQARKKAARVSMAVVVFNMLVCLLIGDGDIQRTRQLMTSHLTSLMIGVILVGLMHLISMKLIGNANFWYSIHDDKIVYHRPPRCEVILEGDIHNIRRIPLGSLSETKSKDSFCVFILLKNKREVRFSGLENMNAGWDLLAERFSEKIVDNDGASGYVSPELISASQLGWWALLAVLWAGISAALFTEKFSASVALFGFACFPVPYLMRYHQHGRPATEDHFVFGSAFLATLFLLAAIGVYVWA